MEAYKGTGEAYMSTELYIKIEQHVEVNKKKVLLSDIAKLHCAKFDVAKELSNIMILNIETTSNSNYAMTFMKVVELIHRKRQDITVINEGEKDFIIEYVPPQDAKVTQNSGVKHPAFEYFKAVFVGIVSFIGAAFTIMTFNVDVSVSEIFDSIYLWFMGVDKKGSLTILELSYCIGLPIGIMVFFNHFNRRKLIMDPTPIHVEMRSYEKQVNEAIIEDASREGKTIDVS